MPDTDARLAAERARRERDASLSSAPAAHILSLFDWDLRTGALQWTPHVEARLGVDSASPVDFESWTREIFPEDVAAIEHALAAAVECRAEGFTFHYRVLQPDGSVRTLDAVAHCFYAADGTPIRASGVTIDVTAQAACETALQNREAQLSLILETVPSAMVVIDQSGLIRRFSAVAEQMFGYGAGELIGRNAIILTPGTLSAQLDSYLEQYRYSRDFNGVRVDYELTARRRDGVEFPIELSVGEMTVGNERLFTGFILDVSEQEAARRTAAELRGELAQVGRVAAMGDMAASLAHELNQPLSATANFLAATTLLLKRGDDTVRVAEMIARANEQIQRAGSIIRNIRDFIVKREVEIGIEPIEQTVRDAVSLVLVGTARTEIEVRYVFGQNSAFMYADRVQIQQVLVNLLRNACDALHGQPKHRRTILIAVRGLVDDMVEISVNDTGPGIAAPVLERIFTRVSSTKGKDGMGLGLSICRRIVEAHGGVLTAENRMAGGASFRFTLPAGPPGGQHGKGRA